MRSHSSQANGNANQPDLVRSAIVAQVAMTDPTGRPRLGKVQIILYVDRYTHAGMRYDIQTIQTNQTEN